MSEQSATAAAEIDAEEPKVKRSPGKKSKRDKPKQQPRYHVILWDDNDHSYEYVMLMLAELFAYPIEKGFTLAREVDKQGRAIVLTTTLEHAELKRDQIHAYGKDPFLKGTCAGSMWATLEAAR